MADIYRSDIVPVDLNKPLSRKHVGSVLATGDNGANRFGASVLRDGLPVDLTGYGVTAYFMRPGQNALVLKGATDGHVAYVDLEQACYTLQSSFTLTIKVSGEGITTALRIIDGYIIITQTDELDAPAETVPTLDDIFAQIAAMETATASANEAAALAIAAKDNANGAAVNAVNIATEKGDQAIQLAQEEADKQNVKIATLTEDIARNTAPPIIPTATGEVVTVSDSAHRPLAGLRLYGKTTQNGTPTPDAPVPLVNVGAGGSIGVKASGKNLLKYPYPHSGMTDAFGVTFSDLGDGRVHFKGAAGGDDGIAYIFRDFTEGQRTELPPGTYTISGNPASNILLLFYFYDGQTGKESFVLTAQNGISIPFVLENTMYYGAYVWIPSGTTVDAVVSPQLEVGSIATAYEPYADGGSLTASTPDGLAGLPYSGGMLCDYIEYGHAVCVRHVGRYHGTVQTNSTGVSAGGLRFIDFYDIPYDASYVGGIMCDALPVVPTADAGWLSTEPCLSVADGRIRLYGVEGVAYTLNILYADQTPGYTPVSAEEMAAYRAMKTLKPHTTVYNDAGTVMHVDYIADTKNYIDQKLAAIAVATL